MKKNIITAAGLVSLIVLSYVGIAQLSTTKKIVIADPEELVEECEPLEQSAPEPTPAPAKDPKVILHPSGLTYTIEKEGTGEPAKKGDHVAVHYTGWLTNGTKFDSSLDRGQPFVFKLGEGRVIRGWDIGVESMRVDEERELNIPSELGYGPHGMPPVIPPNAKLRFKVKVVAIRKGP